MLISLKFRKWRFKEGKESENTTQKETTTTTTTTNKNHLLDFTREIFMIKIKREQV